MGHEQGLLGQSAHLDTTSFLVHGDYIQPNVEKVEIEASNTVLNTETTVDDVEVVNIEAVNVAAEETQPFDNIKPDSKAIVDNLESIGTVVETSKVVTDTPNSNSLPLAKAIDIALQNPQIPTTSTGLEIT